MPYGWSMPQNPISHKSSYTFSENGRLAIMQTLVLLETFKDNPEGNLLLLPTAHTLLTENFGNPIEGILLTTFHGAKTIFQLLSRHLKRADIANIQDGVTTYRSYLRKFFMSSPSGIYQAKANVPNFHMGVHYLQDIELYGTARNSATMMGEQKHKAFKAHAHNTNRHENELQLLKEINATQAVRLLLDNTFAKSYPHMTNLAAEFGQQCPTIKINLIGRQDAINDMERTELDVNLYHATDNIRIEADSVLLSSIHTISKIKKQAIGQNILENDYKLLRLAYRRMYNEDILNKRVFKIQYWRLLSANIVGTNKRYRLDCNTIRSFAYRIDTGQLVFVRRIITITISNICRILLCVEPTKQLVQAELKLLVPYNIYEIAPDGEESTDIISLDSIVADHVHMIATTCNEHTHETGNKAFFLNPFIPDFT
ncbi:hypothetical protein EDC01DRAFT_631239 [Geopyxis carbonaria]|nr:hypothetical protein EDC01DRAFT_631239 [Geopyxis carbonaria]